MGESTRYGKIRADFWGHEKTGWMDPLQRSLYLCCIATSYLGVCQMSLRSMARVHGGRRQAVSIEDVEEAISDMEANGAVKWWPDYEILWVVEAADENIRGSGSHKAWAAASKEWRTIFEPEVRSAILERYPTLNNVSENTKSKKNVCRPHKNEENGNAAHAIEVTGAESTNGKCSDANNSGQDCEVADVQKPAVFETQKTPIFGVLVRDPVGASVPRASSGHMQDLSFIQREAEAKHGREIGGFSSVDPVTKKHNPDEILTNVGRAIAEYGWDRVREVVRFAADRTASTGKDIPLWRYMFRGDGFSAWLDRMGNSAASIETPEQAEAYANAHPQGWLPEGWRWDAKGKVVKA